jgi:hypothetical protein
MSTAARLQQLGLVPSQATLAADKADARAAARETIDRALARASRAEARAGRAPIGSNERRKKLDEAHRLRTHATELARLHDLEDPR